MRVKYCYTWGYCYPVTCGADVVGCNQLDYFRSRGWEVDCLIVNDPRKTRFASLFHEHYPWLKSVTVVDLPAVNFSLRELLFAYEKAAWTPQVRAALAAPADLFFTNYVFTTPFVAHLQAGCRKVLETVDIMTYQFAVAEKQQRGEGKERGAFDRARHEFLLRTELDLYRLFDAVLMINKSECEVVRARGAQNAQYVPQAFVHEQSPRKPEREQYEHDLVFVGSDAEINVRGITWFYRNVYIPHLWRRGVRLLVVGGVCRKLDFADVGVTLLPEVMGPLTDIYASAKVAIAPIFDGTGLSIKTVEALSLGCAMVLTPAGARGLDDDVCAYVKLDMKEQPRQTAEVLLNLLARPEQRRELENAAWYYVRRCFSREAYTKAMDQVLGGLSASRAA